MTFDNYNSQYISANEERPLSKEFRYNSYMQDDCVELLSVG